MYAYQAEPWCDECARKIKAQLRLEAKACGRPSEDIDTGDTDDYPQWGSDDEETDCPEHCAGCGVFLENPLTDNGQRYVGERLADALVAKYNDASVGLCIEEWWDKYHELPTVRLAMAERLWYRASHDAHKQIRTTAGVWLVRFATAGIDWEEVVW
jgi:hypothetical protein